MFTGFLALPAFFSGHAIASPTMAHDTCVVVGTVNSIEKIKITRPRDETWLKSWRLSKTYSEIAIKITPSTIDVFNDMAFDKTSCTLEKAAEGYYLQHRATLKFIPADYKVGDCITAKTNFSGDEFRIGNWIYDIEKQPAELCAPNKDKERTTE